MDRNTVIVSIFTFVTAIVGLGCFTGIITSWFKHRAAAVAPPSAALLARLDEIAQRLASLDGAVDTMAVEVERISEAQRFTARILVERTVPAMQLAASVPAAPDEETVGESARAGDSTPPR